MENAQFSFLNALFGGKSPAGASLLDNASSDETPPEQDQKGFFSFLEGLLPANVDGAVGNEQNLNIPATPQVPIQAPSQAPLTFQSLSINAPLESTDETAEMLDGVAVAGAPFVTTEIAQPVTATVQSNVAAPQIDVVSRFENVAAAGPKADAITRPDNALVGGPQNDATSRSEAITVAGPQLDVTSRLEAVPVAGPQLDDLPHPGNVTVAGVKNTDPLPGPLTNPVADVPPVKKDELKLSPQRPVNPADAVQGQQTTAAGASGNGPVQTSVLRLLDGEAPSSSTDAQIEPELPVEGEARFDQGERRFALDADSADGKVPGLTGNVNAKAVQAITEHASPEAFANSAVTGKDGADGLEFERLASSRLENAASGAGVRNVHVNQVRDQIVAAVVARQGEAKLEIRLDPPELGRVMIGFERDGADIVRAVVTADSPETLDLMRRNAAEFQRSLEEQGFSGLDLQFADTGAGQNASEDNEEGSQTFALVEEEAVTAAASAGAPQLAEGRLDRRL